MEIGLADRRMRERSQQIGNAFRVADANDEDSLKTFLYGSPIRHRGHWLLAVDIIFHYAPLSLCVLKTKREISIMSTVDANRVAFIGENSAIRLSDSDSDSFTTIATFWRAVSSGAGPGHVLYLKSELTEDRWRRYSDNIAMARWLQSTVLGAIYAELLDAIIAVIDAQF
jgi:hypothetical protein